MSLSIRRRSFCLTKATRGRTGILSRRAGLASRKNWIIHRMGNLTCAQGETSVPICTCVCVCRREEKSRKLALKLSGLASFVQYCRSQISPAYRRTERLVALTCCHREAPIYPWWPTPGKLCTVYCSPWGAFVPLALVHVLCPCALKLTTHNGGICTADTWFRSVSHGRGEPPTPWVQCCAWGPFNS